MIKIRAYGKRMFEMEEHVVVPTVFPDGTSQVWHLPEQLLTSYNDFEVVWNFEQEREILDVAGIAKLLPAGSTKKLHIPYLPYGRQDKEVSNSTTFNLHVFADFINSLGFNLVTSIDVHNPVACAKLFKKFKNIDMFNIHGDVIRRFDPDFLVFPDKGASTRYKFNNELPMIHFDKLRNQETGQITGLKGWGTDNLFPRAKCLIIDDICDFGRTFTGVASELKKLHKDLHISLFVTHGLFSGGKGVIHEGGIDVIATTNSIIKNMDALYEV